MRFYIFRSRHVNQHEPPVTCVPLTKEQPEGFDIPDWILEADSFEDAFEKLMPQSPFNEFMVGKSHVPDEGSPEWYIEIYD